MPTFELTTKQHEANRVIAGHRYSHLFGGSRSGKTFVYCRAIAARALKAPKSRHLIARFRFNHCKTSIALDTWPKMMELAFPRVPYVVDRTDWFATLPNGSEVWFGGLDDKQRTDKILGHEYVTAYLVECSEISYEARAKLLTRLAQSVFQVITGPDGKPTKTLLEPRMYSDCNPTTRAHWSHKLYVQKVNPETGITMGDAHQYASLQMNPGDNLANLPPGYLNTLESLPAHLRRRFLAGNYGDANPGALFDEATIDKWRVVDGELPEMQRIAVGVDPSGQSDRDEGATGHDEVGIAVVGLGVDGVAYVLEDSSLAAGPGRWSKVATGRYRAHGADVLVGEVNYGGGMVESVIQTADPGVLYKAVTATRGKVVRAEPFSALYEDGRVRHVGRMPDLEAELTGFTTGGYVGERSPNRADAVIWALAELLPGVVRAAQMEVSGMPDDLDYNYGMVA